MFDLKNDGVSYLKSNISFVVCLCVFIVLQSIRVFIFIEFSM